ncbi:MAG: hypothetical protein HY459_05045 [Parcubacteria group bacterium]|nr:hypothetical protein [Parcubacteria group bacterium]
MSQSFVRTAQEIRETPGEITLKLYPRDKDGDYWRINHAPIKKLLMWPRGSYEMVKDRDPKTGQIFFEIRLRPDTF